MPQLLSCMLWRGTLVVVVLENHSVAPSSENLWMHEPTRGARRITLCMAASASKGTADLPSSLFKLSKAGSRTCV